MATIILTVPDALAKEDEETVKFLAAKLYEARKVTLKQAAEMCSLPKWDFPQVLAKFDVSYFQYTGKDLLNEFE